MLTILSTLLAQHWRDLAPYLVLLAALHALVELGVPALWPEAYDALNAGAAAAGKPLRSRRELARDVRTRVVASLFSVYVVGSAVWGVWAGDYAALAGAGFSASTPLTAHLVRVAAAFFLWDTYVCVADGYAPAYIFHGLACTAVFVMALRPTMQGMSLVVLGFEASTPLLHTRLLLIAADRARGRCFAATTYGFAATFFLSRIAIGYPLSLAWGRQVVMELIQPAQGTPPIILVAYLVLCVSLSALNGYWFVKIVAVAVWGGGAKARKQHGEPAARSRAESCKIE